MKIKDIFSKPIDREIRGVIKVGQDEDIFKKQELEEYVVTNELKDHFNRFFEAYDRSIDNPTDQMGAWISGFFGSGKSHFLKILSYLLSNKAVAGKMPLDYFSNGKVDQDTFELMQKSVKVNNKVILFNIDSKADSEAVNDKSAILTVFLKVFNESLGYSSDPVVANMERYLASTNNYQNFKNKFREETGADWEDQRDNYSFMLNTIKEALVNSQAMTEADAEEYVEKLKTGKGGDITPEDFASLVKDYLDKQDSREHIVFMADEVGQFIGDDSQRMLNLQTIVEQLGSQCHGRAWVVVTSQQQIDQVTSNFNNQNKQDFSKIQGRFNTMINMSSANADEVIQKRILDKTDLAKEQLESIFENNSYSINNTISFSDSISRDKYSDAKSFVTNYPFVPYQFTLLKQVLDAVRKHGANGKHMSDGERSMLATFQRATQAYENTEVGGLVPFAEFFNGMKEFLSHDHQVVFTNAMSNAEICPDGPKSFNYQVLEVLFMIKYLDSYPGTIENIATLLIDSIYTDRQRLEEKVKHSLNLLKKQNYIQQKADEYEFLTDKEQDINSEINAIDVDDNSVINLINSYIFGTNLVETKYAPKNLAGQYVFGFNGYVDDRPSGRTNNEQDVRIYTPLSQMAEQSISLNTLSGKIVAVLLPDDDSYIELYRSYQKLTTYLKQKHNPNDPNEQSLIYAKRAEATEIEGLAQEALKNVLDHATIFYLNEVDKDQTNLKLRLRKAYDEVINNNYRKLSDLDTIKSEADIKSLLKNSEGTDVGLVEDNDNKDAVQSLLDLINLQTQNGLTSISVAAVVDKMNAIPYGYNEVDVAWLVAKAYVDGKISLAFNNEKLPLTFAQDNPGRVLDYLTKKTFVTKTTIKLVHEISKKQLGDAQDFVRDILNKKSILIKSNNSNEQLAEAIKHECEAKITELRGYQHIVGPSTNDLDDGINLFSKIVRAEDSEKIFAIISKTLDDFYDWDEAMEDKGLYEFYRSEDKQNIWQRAIANKKRYEGVAGFVEKDNGTKKIVEDINAELNKTNISKVIAQLKILNENFITKFSELIEEQYQKYAEDSNRYAALLKERLTDSGLPGDYSAKLEEDINNTLSSIDSEAKAASEKGDYIKLINQNKYLERAVEELQDQIDQTTQKVADIARKQAQKVNEMTKQEDEQPASSNESNDNVSTVSSTPAPAKPKIQVKRTKSLRITELERESWRITSQEDLDRYLENLRQEITQQLDENDIVNVDFR